MFAIILSMRCEILSTVAKEVNCEQKPTGDCVNCLKASRYMSLFGIGLFLSRLESRENMSVGHDLIYHVTFNDDDPNIYECRISQGKYSFSKTIEQPTETDQ